MPLVGVEGALEDHPSPPPPPEGACSPEVMAAGVMVEVIRS